MPSTKSTATVRKPTRVQNKKIEERAYQLFADRGYDHGHDLEDWLQAESEVMTATARRKPAPVEAGAPSAPARKSRGKTAA